MGTAFKNPLQIIGFVGEGTLADGVAVVVGSADMTCALPGGADPTSGVLGLVKREGYGSYTAGQTVDVVLSGIYPGIAAGTIARGALVAINGSTGTLKTAAPSAGVNDMVVGMALESAVSGDRFAVLVNPHLIQGA